MTRNINMRIILLWVWLFICAGVAVYVAVKEPVWFACWLSALVMILRFNHNAKKNQKVK
tara:strand:+ start:808 stop:984 length:177 start_codon:yes stop_codon:yes gene_type:complete